MALTLADLLSCPSVSIIRFASALVKERNQANNVGGSKGFTV